MLTGIFRGLMDGRVRGKGMRIGGGGEKGRAEVGDFETRERSRYRPVCGLAVLDLRLLHLIFLILFYLILSYLSYLIACFTSVCVNN